MKLKRCPNLHYYDGDKYDRCPHCNQTDEKVKVQEPKPTPAPKPEPEPQPAPTPVPKPSAPVAQEPDESNAWRCQCGAVSHGLFCPQCGSRKPGPQPVKEDPKPAPVSQPVPQPSPEPEAVEEPVAVPEPIAEPSPEPLSEPEAFPLTESAPLVNHIRDDGFTGDSFEEPLKEEQEDDGEMPPAGQGFADGKGDGERTKARAEAFDGDNLHRRVSPSPPYRECHADASAPR